MFIWRVTKEVTRGKAGVECGTCWSARVCADRPLLTDGMESVPADKVVVFKYTERPGRKRESGEVRPVLSRAGVRAHVCSTSNWCQRQHANEYSK